MNIFTNSIGTFTELTNILSSLPKPIQTFQSVLFKLKEGEYKNFSKYTDGLKLIINNLLDIFPDFYFTLFIDNSITKHKQIYKDINDIINSSKNKNRVIVIKYHFTDFRDCSKRYHMELFGHLIRFYPWFDFDNNPFGFAFCIDCDDGLSLVPYYKVMIEVHKKYNSQLTYANFFNRVVMNKPTYEKRLKDKYKRDNPYFCPANIVAGDMKVEHKLIEDFIFEVKKGKFVDLFTDKTKKKYETFGYGIDEVFINDYLIDYLNKHEKTITPFVAFNVFKTTTILTPSDALKKHLEEITGMKFNEILLGIYHLLDFDTTKYNDMYLKIYLDIVDMFNRKDYSIIKDYDLTSITYYPGYILKYYVPLFIGGKLIREDRIYAIGYEEEKLVKVNYVTKKIY